MSDASIEARTRQIGQALLAEMGRYRPGVAERAEDWLLTHAVADPHFRTRMLRFLDVLAAFEDPRQAPEVARLFREYFSSDFPGVPTLLRALLALGRASFVPAPVLAAAARKGAGIFASRFITDPSPGGTRELIDELSALHRYPSFDLLGEAVLSEREAEAYEARYLSLLADLARAPQARMRTPAGEPALQVSLKLSSLTHHFSPVDVEGSVQRVLPRLTRIARAARDAGIGLTVDAEQHATRDVVWSAFQRAFGPDSELADWPDAGLVVQSYLRDAEAHADEVVAFARERGASIQVRLVKGAYWDYEMAVAAANRWTPPVFRVKAATDRSAERCVDRLLEASGAVRLAVGSHNPRLHAYAHAVAEDRGAPGAVEHQTLHRTSEAMSRALAAQGWSARDYVPVGELLPGMAYLVRRVLENSSQAGFLMHSRQDADHESLLASPVVTDPVVEDRARVEPDGATFERTPAARWFDGAFREAFEAALVSRLAAPAVLLPLPEGIEGEGQAELHSPSAPTGTPIAFVELASPEGTRAAVERGVAAQPGWASRLPSDRAAILHRTADLLVERGHTFAAAIVVEGGRDRAGAWAEVEEAADFLRLYAGEAETLFTGYSERVRPRGVVAVIPPWNFSLAIPCGMTVAAIACGNTAVLKPAGQTPVVASMLVSLLHEAGVPEAVVQCLPGAGSRAGQALVEDARVAMVAFTGSREVGTSIHDAVSRVPLPSGRPRGLVAEMGGKNPAIVFSDADLDEAVEGIIHSTFDHANQKCSAVSRVLVQRSVYPMFRDRLIDAAASLVCGPAHEASTQVNPVIDRRASERLLEAARVARSEGRLLLDRFNPAPGSLAHGPLIVEIDLSRVLTARTATEELFGPILVLTPFDDDADAYRVANGTAYGLTSAVFSRSPERIEVATAAIEAGHVYVNRTSTAARPGVEPFGGMKFSGTGPKVGDTAYLWAFLERADASDGTSALSDTSPSAPALTPARWDLPLAMRIEVLSRAGHLLGGSGRDLLAAAAADLGPVPTVQVAGQDTEVVYDTPRGLGIISAQGEDAGLWLLAALAAGNAVVVVDSPALKPLVETLRGEGVPAGVLRVEPGGVETLLGLASSTAVAFVASDHGPYAALASALGAAGVEHLGLRALLSPLDGPQPREPGFVRRFAWPKVVAIRTLRHGATLEFSDAEGDR